MDSIIHNKGAVMDHGMYSILQKDSPLRGLHYDQLVPKLAAIRIGLHQIKRFINT